MAYVTIPQLPLGSDLTGLEQFEAVQASSSVRLTAAQLKTFCVSAPDLTVTDTNLSGVSIAATFTHIVTGTPSVGIGVGIDFDTEISPANVITGGSIQSVSTNDTATQEDFALAFSTMQDGVLAERARLGDSGYFGIGTTSPIAPLEATIDDTSSSAVSISAAITHTTASPSAGIGVGLAFRASTSLSTITEGARISAVSTTIALGAEAFDLAIALTRLGSVNQEVARFTSAGQLGLNTTTPATTLEVVRDNATTNTVLSVARFTRTSTGTPAAGIGTQIDFAAETSVGTNKVGSSIYSISTSLATSSENFDLGLSTLVAGFNTEVVRITSGKNVGINTSSPATTLHVVSSDSATNTVLPTARLTRNTTATPTVGIGTSLEFDTEVQVSANAIGSVIESVSTSLSVGAENFDLVFKTMASGATATEKLRIGSSVITPAVQFSQFGAGITPVATSYILAQTNSLTIAPFRFSTTTPTLLTTAQAGALEYNGNALYFTPSGVQRGAVVSEQVYINSAGTRAGPNAVTTAQSATFTGGSSTITVTTVPGSAIGNTGALVIFAGTTAPTGITFGQPYYVNWLTATTMTVSATQSGTPITPSTAGAAVTATFYFPVLGNGVTSVGVDLAANTRYLYEMVFTISHTGATATSVAYALLSISGTLSAHAYRVTSQNSTAAISGNLTGLAATSSNFISNYITTGFSTFVTVTGVTAATANTSNLVRIEGQIDTLTDCGGVVPVIGFPVAPTLTTIYQGAYMRIYPVGPVVSNTAIGAWS
jgi:hypothetical protein